MKTDLRFALLVLIVSGLLVVGCSRNPVTGEKEPSLISESEEIAMGQQAGPEFEKEFGGKVANPQLQAYVQTIGARLAAVSDRDMPYEFAILVSDVPNAFALPGGKIYVSAGLFKNMTNERQLAAVLSHEIVHVAAKHSVNALQRQMGAAVVVELVGTIVGGEGAQTAQAATKLAAGMYNLNYSRGQELQSDAVGIKYMDRANYNPWGMVELLETIQSLSQSKPGLFGDFFSTHPLTTERIDDARDIINEQYAGYSPDTPDPNIDSFLQIRKLLE